MELLRCTVASLLRGSPGDKQLYRSIQRTTATYVERNEQHMSGLELKSYVVKKYNHCI